MTSREEQIEERNSWVELKDYMATQGHVIETKGDIHSSISAYRRVILPTLRRDPAHDGNTGKIYTESCVSGWNK